MKMPRIGRVFKKRKFRGNRFTRVLTENQNKSNIEGPQGGNIKSSQEMPENSVMPGADGYYEQVFVPVGTTIKKEPAETEDVDGLSTFSEELDVKPSELNLVNCLNTSTYFAYPAMLCENSLSLDGISEQRRSKTSIVVTEKNTTGPDEDFANLKNVVGKLEKISDKLVAAAFQDHCEEFAKYLASLLRGIPLKQFLSLKLKLINDVVQAKIALENTDIPNSLVGSSTVPNPMSQPGLPHSETSDMFHSSRGDFNSPISLSDCPTAAPNSMDSPPCRSISNPLSQQGVLHPEGSNRCHTNGEDLYLSGKKDVSALNPAGDTGSLKIIPVTSMSSPHEPFALEPPKETVEGCGNYKNVNHSSSSSNEESVQLDIEEEAVLYDVKQELLETSDANGYHSQQECITTSQYSAPKEYEKILSAPSKSSSENSEDPLKEDLSWHLTVLHPDDDPMEANQEIAVFNRRKTCRFCPPRLKRKTKYPCGKCGQAICLECARKVCLRCFYAGS